MWRRRSKTPAQDAPSALDPVVFAVTQPLTRDVADDLAGQAARVDADLRIVVDLTETTFLDSTALGVLIGAVKRLRSRDGVLTIVNTDANIAKTFEITGLDQIFTIRPTREEAIEALDAGSAAKAP